MIVHRTHMARTAKHKTRTNGDSSHPVAEEPKGRASISSVHIVGGQTAWRTFERGCVCSPLSGAKNFQCVLL